MRTTLNLSAEAVTKVQQLAQQHCKTTGAVASELILRALEPDGSPTVRNGVPLIPVDMGTEYEETPPDLAVVNRLRDSEL